MEVNDYLKQMEDRDNAERTRLSASATLAIDSSPEEIARQKRIANLLGTPVAAVQGDPSTARQQATVTTWEKDTRDAPGTREKYTDADFAALAQDQSGPLAKVERFTRNIAAGFGGDFVGSSTAGLGRALNSFERLLTSGESPIYEKTPGQMYREWKEKNQLIGAGDLLVEAGETTKKYFKDIAPKGEPSFSDQVARGLGQLPGQLALFANPYTAPVGIAMMYGQGADQMYEKIAKDKKAQQASQVDQDLEILSGGGITAATEWLASKLLLKPPQLLALKSKLLGYTAKVALGGAEEGTQELMENIGQDIVHIAMTNPESKIAFGEAFEAGGVGGVVGSIASSVINAALHIKTRRFQQSLTDLSDASKAQQVRERDPETYQGFADAITGHLAGTTDGAVENLYIDANVFAQAMTENKIDPAKAVAAMGIDPQIFDEAKVTGGDLVIPMNDFVGKVAGTEIGDMLNPHLRSAPDAVSIAELAEIAKIAPDLQAKADQIAAKQTERKEWTQSMAEVQRTIADQLIATGIYSPSVSRMQSSLAANMYANIASEMGITPAELYQMKPYKVEMGELNKDQSGITYNQEGNINIDENFKNWFGESKVVDAEGKPLVVYHGSKNKFTEFEHGHGDFYEINNQYGPGFYLTNHKKSATSYGKNVIEGYASIQNPITRKTNFFTDDAIRQVLDRADYAFGQEWNAWNQRQDKSAPKSEIVDEFIRRQSNNNDLEKIKAMVKWFKSPETMKQAIADVTGADGVIAKDVLKDIDVFTVFSPTQIKSVFNRGTFDPNNPNILMQSAWHGSPHTFDKFSTSAIGTGEGAQAYGYGLYFAGSKAIAEYYKDALAKRKAKFNGVEIPYTISDESHPLAKEAERFLGTNRYLLPTLNDALADIGELSRDEIRNRIGNDEYGYTRQQAAKLADHLIDFGVTVNKDGRLYKVELAPAEDEYLLWDKPLSEQSEKVREALAEVGGTPADIEKAIALYSDRQNLEGVRGEMAREEIAKLQRRLDNANLMTGEELYRRFSQENQKGAKAASEYLHSLGIRGIKYEDGNTRNKDGEKNYNYVIFSDDDVAIQEMYQKMNGRKRAGFDPSRLTTVLTKESDLSSFFHETGHFFLTVYSDLAADPNATPRMQQDMQTILDWFGVKDLAAWNAMTLEEQRPYHEQFAYNYEIYLFEGKAPSIQMQTVFERFSAWLKKVYSSIRDELNQVYKKEHGKDLPILTGEVRDVMDRMLASDKQIREAEAVRGMMPIFRTQEESGMTDEEWIAYQSMSDEAHQAALDQHTQASLRQMKWLEGAKSKVLKGLQAQAKEARAKVKAEVTQEVMMEPIYRAIQFLKTGEAVFSEGKSVKEEGPHKLSIEALKQMYPDKPAKEKKVKPPKFRSFLGDISKAGGITYDSLVRALDVNEIRGDKGGNRFMAITGRKGRGWGMDQMAGMMQDQGWDVPMDADGNLDTDAFAQMVKEAVNGNRPVHPDDVGTVVEQEDAARALAEDDDYLKSLVEFYDQQQIDPGYPEWQALGYGKSGMLAEDGLHPDLIAGLFGFHSGDALVRALLDTAPIKKTINSLTDQRMLEEHGELTDPKALAIAVDRAIHNEARARFIAVELRHLAKSVRPVRVMQEAARQAARAIIGKKPIGTINPKDYSGAEAKAAVAAEAAMKKGDTAAATQAKEHQLLQNMLSSESLKANTFVAEQLDGFKKVFSPDKRLSKTRDMNYVNVARSILAHYGIGSATETADSYLSKIRQYDPEFYAEIEPMITAHQEASKFATDLTFDQFQDLADQVQMLWHLSRRVKQIEIDGQLMDRKEVVGMLDSRIRSLIKPGERAGYTKAMTKWDEAKIKLMGVRASLRRVESWVDAMDGGNPAGPFRTFIWNPISEAVTKFRGAQGKYFGRYVEILKEAEITLQGQDIVAEELDYTFKPQELLHAILHTGNSSNKRKLLLGRGWAEFSEDGETLDTSRWDTFINRAVAEGRITKDYYDFAQKVWDLMEEMKPGAQKAHHDMYGYYFNEITAEALETPWGVYAGGYVPAVTDARIVTEGALRNEQETQMADNSFMFPTTGRGFTKGRVEYNRPLLLDLGYLASHIDKVLRFTYIEPRVKDVARIVKTNKAFGETMDELDPTVRNDMLVPWLQRTAMQMVSTPSKGWGGKAADSFFTYLRTNTGLQMMVANVTNTLQQFTGLSISALKVKPALLRNALWQYTRQPGDTVQMVADKSDYMKTRMTAQQYEMRQKMDALLLNPTKYDKVVEFAKEHGYFMQQATQNIVDTITWVGAYNQAVQTGVSEKDAVRQADSAVRQTQGSFAPEDISRFETGSAFVRAFTHFYSYFNMQANVLGTEFVKVARELGVKDGAGKMLYIYTFGFMIPAVLSEMIVQAAGGFDAGDDDEYDLWNAMGLFFGSQFRTLSAMVPGVGPAVVAGVNAWNRKPYDDRMSTSPAVSTIEATVSAPHSVYKAIAEDGSWKKATRDTLTALGLITRLPLGQLGKPAGYLMDVQQGKAEPEGVTDVVRGLISGKDVNRKQ